MERIQRRATKFILNDYSSNYKSRLLNLNILPLMYQFDYYDILFFIKHIKYPTDNFNIFNHVTFSHGSTRSSSHSKLHHKYSAINVNSSPFLLYNINLYLFIHHYLLIVVGVGKCTRGSTCLEGIKNSHRL